MRGGQALHDRQPEAGAAGRAVAGAIGAEERLEQLRQVVGRDARAVVQHLEEHVVALAADTQLDLRARVAHGVVEQVDEHAQERRVVAVSAMRRGRRDDDDPRVDGVGRLVRERHGVERARAQLGPRVLEPAEREEVADEPVQQRRLVLRAAQVVGVADAVLDRLERAAEREQRRAQVVGDRADEEASLLLGGVLLGQRVAQAVGHPPQRHADLGDLARARVDRRDVELAARDALGVGRSRASGGRPSAAGA